MNGLYDKYEVKKRHGDTDPNADYFVLRLDKDPHARQAARCYAESIKQENRTLAFEIMTKILKYENQSLENGPDLNIIPDEPEC